ncbi:MAG TPA: SDR family oxidoreductase [Pilimelia sp.]|nr:SDR family oxidoreductase [Pilimelia sp.]
MNGSSRSSTDRRVLVTGASTGIGRAIAERFVERGWVVLGTSRDPAGLRPEQRVAGVTYLRLDQADAGSIRECAAAAGGLDLLVNNAGQSQGGALEHLPDDAVRHLFQIDVFGPVELTRLVLPGMRARGGGRIVFVGSLMADFPVPFQGSYAAAKLALRGFVLALRTEVAPFGIAVALVQPGYFKSEINDRRQWHTAPDSPYTAQLDRVIARVSGDHRKAADPRLVAEHVARLVDTRRPRPVTAVGSSGPALRFARRFMSDRFAEAMVARRYGLVSATARPVSREET